jgi:hypothetical protein
MAPTDPWGDPPAAGVSRRRLRLDAVVCDTAPDGRCLLSVDLEWCGRVVRGEARSLDTHHGRVRASADAALAAALAAAGRHVHLELVGVKAFRAFDGWVVVVRVLGSAGDKDFRLLGAASSEEERGLPRASAEAVLDATNRVVEGYALP